MYNMDISLCLREAASGSRVAAEQSSEPNHGHTSEWRQNWG